MDDGFIVTSIPQVAPAAKELRPYSVGVTQGDKDKKDGAGSGASGIIDSLKDKPKGLRKI